MQELGLHRLAAAALVAAGLCWVLPAQEVDSDRVATPDTTLVQDLTRPGQPVRISTLWIGAVCSPVDELLRSHLNLPESAGLVVHSTVPGSPAEEAGLQQYDILVSANDVPLTGLEQLVEAVEDSDGKAMKFTWLRKGEEMTKEITPAKRPTEMKWSPGEEGSGWTPNVDTKALEQWVENLRTSSGQSVPFEFRAFGPGIARGVVPEAFAGNLSVQIEKQGDEPARITVSRDDEKWEVTEETLDQLPDDLQGRVEAMLGKGGVRVFSFEGKDGKPLELEGLQQLQGVELPEMPPSMKQEFDEMHRRMEEMLRQLHELREQPEANEEGDAEARRFVAFGNLQVA